jgi:hypothetical protein
LVGLIFSIPIFFIFILLSSALKKKQIFFTLDVKQTFFNPKQFMIKRNRFP